MRGSKNGAEAALLWHSLSISSLPFCFRVLFCLSFLVLDSIKPPKPRTIDPHRCHHHHLVHHTHRPPYTLHNTACQSFIQTQPPTPQKWSTDTTTIGPTRRLDPPAVQTSAPSCVTIEVNEFLNEFLNEFNELIEFDPAAVRIQGPDCAGLSADALTGCHHHINYHPVKFYNPPNSHTPSLCPETFCPSRYHPVKFYTLTRSHTHSVCGKFAMTG